MYSSKVGDRDDQFYCNDYLHLDNLMAFELNLFPLKIQRELYKLLPHTKGLVYDSVHFC